MSDYHKNYVEQCDARIKELENLLEDTKKSFLDDYIEIDKRLHVAVEALDHYADLDEEVSLYDSRGVSTAREALSKIRGKNE